MNLPLDPKKVAAEAIASGALRVGGELLTREQCLKAVSPWPNEEFDYQPRVKLPAEVGLQAAHPAPKADGRTKAVRRHKPHPSGNKKYIVTLAQLRAERPHLYL